jgi:hypothetical protein
MFTTTTYGEYIYKYCPVEPCAMDTCLFNKVSLQYLFSLCSWLLLDLLTPQIPSDLEPTKEAKGLRAAGTSRIFRFLKHVIPFAAVTRIRGFARN